jgi:broad specificity phosphatase PhoE
MIFRSLLIALLFAVFVSLPSFAYAQTWYFVRHFEKQQGDNPILTETGKARAKALAVFFSDKPLTQVYSTDYHRTLETATPVTELKNLPITVYEPQNLTEFSTKLKTQDHVLVVGHSNTTPQLLSLMGGKDINIKEGDFGIVYMLLKDGDEITTHSIHIPHQ